MASFAAVAAPQEEGGENLADWQQGIPSNIVHYSETSKSQSPHFQNDEISSSGDELMTKVRKPYTITKQRERWTEEEHQKFLEALKMHGRAWRRIEEHIGSKTAVQIRSHAQKFFSKLEREASARGVTVTKTQDISIPPPRPKRKPSHPYPRKAGSVIQSCSSATEEENRSLLAVSSTCDKLSVGVNLSGTTRKNAAFAPYNARSSPLQRKGNINMQDTKMESSSTNSSPSSLKLFGQTVVVPINETDLDANSNGVFCEFTSLKQEFTPFEGQNTDYSKLENGKVSQVQQTCSLKPQTKLVKSGNASVLTSNSPPTESGASPQEGTGESNANSPYLENHTGQQDSDEHLSSELDNSSNYLCKNLQSSVPVPGYPRHVPVQHVETGSSDNVPNSIKCKPNASSLAHEFAAMSMLNVNGSSSNLTGQMQTDIQNPLVPNFLLPFPGMPGPYPAYNNFESFGCIPGFIAPGSAPNGPLPPWHLPPSAAMHHPAYAAATLAAARYWPGLVSGVTGATMGDPQHSSTGTNAHALSDETSAAAAVTAATVAAASAWWTLHGAIPPPFLHPGIYAPFLAVMAAEAAAVAAAAAATGNSSPGCKSEPVTEARKQDQVTTMKEANKVLESMPNNPCSKSERKVSMQQLNDGNTSSLCPKPGSLESSPQGPPSGSDQNAISCMEESYDAEMHREKQNLNLKEKDYNVHSTNSPVGETTTNKKFVKERSSSGSNTPSSAEPETDACLEANIEMIKGNIEGDFELNGTGNCTSEAGPGDKLTKVGGFAFLQTLGKIERERNNSSTVQDEKTDDIRKHIPKDRHQSHGGDSYRRSKSGVHPSDTWKAVSEEGRIAFQALFSRDILPQSFSPPQSTKLQEKVPRSSDESLSAKHNAITPSPDGMQTDTQSSLLNESQVNNSVTQARDDCAGEMPSNAVASLARETKLLQDSEATVSDQSLEECGDCGTSPLPNENAAVDIQPTKSSVIPSFGNFISGRGFVPYQRCSVEAKKGRLHARPVHNTQEGIREEKRICLEQEVKES